MKKLMLTNKTYGYEHLPSVTLDKEKSIFKIYGHILDDEQIDEHLSTVKQWIKEYQKQANDNSDFHLGFHYMSEYGISCVEELVTLISKIDNVKIYWEYHPDDEDMAEIVSEVSALTGVEIISRKILITNSIFGSPTFVPNT